MASARIRRAIAAALIAAAGAAAAFRILSGNALIQTDLVYSPSLQERIPGAKDPESTARSFYLYIDGGMYDEAYEVSLEPARRRDGGQGGEGVRGWTSREEFVRRMNGELGRGGSGIRLGNVRAGRAQPLGVDVGNFGGGSGTTASTRAEARRPPAGRLEGAFRVRVSGHMLGACSVFRWEKNLTVLETGGRFKVLLDEAPEARALSYRSWFENVEKVADLRGGAE